MRIKTLISLMLISLAPSFSFAVSSTGPGGIKYNLEPIVGFETTYRNTPTPHTSTRAIYGARATAGVDLLMGELEYTKGSDTKTFSTAPESVKNTDEKAKLGIRSTYHFNSYLFISGRLGGQATKNIREETNGGVVTITEPPIKYHPYAGASLGLRFGSVASISLGTTMIFKDSKDPSKNDVQNTVSARFGF